MQLQESKNYDISLNEINNLSISSTTYIYDF